MISSNVSEEAPEGNERNKARASVILMNSILTISFSTTGLSSFNKLGPSIDKWILLCVTVL